MKKVIAFLFALALFSSSVIGFADGIPGVEAFPTMNVTGISRIRGIDVQYYRIILGGPVLRLYVLYADRDGGKEELRVFTNGDNQLEANTLTLSRKFMPGIKMGGSKDQVDETSGEPAVLIPKGDSTDGPGGEGYFEAGRTKKKLEERDEAEIRKARAAYYSELHTGEGITDILSVTRPHYVEAEGGTWVYGVLEVQVIHRFKMPLDKQKGANIAKPNDKAFAVVVDVNNTEYVGFYNRAGKLVDIEANNGRY